jgi:type II secretory pathway pseudopilin PulG
VAGDSSSREQNYWPGFVDALTNVVLVMVFVIVVFAISMFGALIKLSNAHLQRNLAERMHEKNQSIQQSLQEAQAEAKREHERAELLQQENQRLHSELIGQQQAVGKARPRQAHSEMAPAVVISGKMPNISLSYALGVTALEKKLMQSLDGLIGDFDKASQWHVLLHATMAEPAPSEARRLAFYRIAVIRDHLVAQGVLPQHIETVILDTPSSDSRSHVDVQIRRSPE